MHQTLEFTISEAETIAALKFNQKRIVLKARPPWLGRAFFALSLAAWFVFGLLGTDKLIANDSGFNSQALFLLGAALAITFASQLHLRAALFRYLASQPGAQPESRTVTLNEAGLQAIGTRGEAFIPWPKIHALEGLPGQTLVYVDRASFVQIPHRAFASDSERTACLDWIRQRMAHDDGVPVDARPGEAPVSPCESVPSAASNNDESPAIRPFPAFLGLLGQGLRLALFMRPTAATARPSWTQLLALLALVLGLPLGADLITVGWNGHFSTYAVPGVLFILPILMLVAWVLVKLGGASERTLELLLVFISLSLPIDLASNILSRLIEAEILPSFSRHLGYLAYYLPTVWLVLATTLAAIRLLALPGQRWLAAATATVLLVGAPLSLVYRDRTLWQPAYDPDAQNERNHYRALATEDAFYLQPTLLERQLSALQPGEKGKVELYFVGAAGDAGQDVFMKEVQSVARLFDERFGTTGRSLTLINNAHTVAELPIASTTSLRLALKRVGEVMDRDEDILFLFLTSHGSQDHHFTLRFGSLRFNVLDPRHLRAMIDEAGIKRRVIVVSGCYSGGYIAALKDENTLAITASAPDKTSFGCSNAAEFTYFGKAYFDEALRQTYSFAEAFELAKPRIGERERMQDYELSDPRIHLGSEIRPVLEQLALAKMATPPVDAAPITASTTTRDAFDDYLEMTGLTNEVRQSRLDCRKEMERYSPASTVLDNPAAFGDIKPGTSHWPRLVASWERYAEDWCASASDIRLYRQLYGDVWREHLKQSDIETAMRFLKTPSGQRFLTTKTKVDRAVSARMLEIRAPLGQKIQRRYQTEQAALTL